MTGEDSLLVCAHCKIWSRQVELLRKALLCLDRLDDVFAALVDVLSFGGRHCWCCLVVEGVCAEEVDIGSRMCTPKG